MIIKSLDDKSTEISALEQLLAQASGNKKKLIEAELRTLRAGISGEKDAAYYIDFDLRNTKNWVVIHDLRVEVGDRVAQIDHLLMNRILEIYVLESKSVKASLRITEEGEFLRSHNGKAYEGMPSPLAQNERHIAVLKDAIKQIELPSRLGVRLEPTFESFVLISPKTRIDRPKNFDTSRIVKADVFIKTLLERPEEEDFVKVLFSASKVISQETLADLGRKIAALHRPARIDYKAKFGLTGAAECVRKPLARQPPASGNDSSPVCRHCNSDQLAILYGQYGYYFKCATCDGNTPIKISCGVDGHKERIRKQGLQFFRECERCGTSHLFYTNSSESISKINA
jgi:hypothetical protein